jgi:serine/threonine protein kinase
VFLAKHITTGRQFALKQLSKNELVQKRQLRYALTELDVLKRSDNPFIVRLHYAFQTKDYLYMAMTYCPNGTLSTSLIDSEEMIARNGQLSVEDAIIYICELIVAIEFLHDMDVLYRDLKPENLLIGNDYHLLLSDFGLAKTEIGPKDFTESFCGSPLYVSPEMLVHGKANRMSDIYGIGAVMYEMVHGHTLFECEDIGEAF